MKLEIIRLHTEKWLPGTAWRRVRRGFDADVVGGGRPTSYSPLPSCMRGGIFAT